MSENIFLRALDKAVSTLTGPENAVRPPARTVVEYPGEHVPAATGPAVERAVFVPDGVNPDFKGASRCGTLDGGTDPDPGPPLPAKAHAELHPKLRPPPPPDPLAGTPRQSPSQELLFDAELKRSGLPQPPPLLIEELLELTTPWERLQFAAAECGKSQTGKYHAHLADIAARTARGDTTVEKEDSWSLDDWNNDARERLKAFKQKIREIENAAWAKVEPYLLTKAAFADEVADLLDAEAKPRFEQFGLPFVSPAYVMLLRRYAASLRDGSRRYVGKPSEMAGAL